MADVPAYLKPNDVVDAANVAPQTAPITPDSFKTPEPQAPPPSAPQPQAIELFDHSNQTVVKVPETDVEALISSGQYTPKIGSRFVVKNPDTGELQDIDASELGKAVSGGFKLETPQERDARELQRDYGDKELLAAGAGVLRGATLGLSDPFLTHVAGVAPETLRKLQQANPVVSGGAEAAGIGASLLVPGLGEAGVAGKAAGVATAGVKGVEAIGALSERAAARQIEKMAAASGLQGTLGAKIAAKIVPKIAQGTAEGAVYGAGNLISEDALGKADFNAENLVGAIGGGALFGGALGGTLGAAYAAAPGAKTAVKKLMGPVGEIAGGYLDKNKAAMELYGIEGAAAKKISERNPEFVQDMPDFIKDRVGLQQGDSFEKVAERNAALKESSGQQIGDNLNLLNDYFDQKVRPIGDAHVPGSSNMYEDALAHTNTMGPTVEHTMPFAKKELADVKIYVAPNGQSGYKIAPDGTIVQMFAKDPASFERVMDDAVLNKGASKIEMQGQAGPAVDKYFDAGMKTPASPGAPETTAFNLNPDKLEKWNGIPTNRSFFDKVADDLTTKMSEITKGAPGFEDQMSPVTKYIKNIRDMAQKEGSLNAKRLQELKIATDELIDYDRTPGSWTLKNQAAYEVRSMLKHSIANLADVASKDVNMGNIAEELRRANKDYQYSSILETFAEKKLAKEKFGKLGLRDYFEISAAMQNPLAGAAILGKRFMDSDMRRKMVILGSIEKAQNDMTKSINSAVSGFFSPVVKGVARGARPATINAIINSNLSLNLDTNKRAKNQAEAYTNMQQNLQKFSQNPEMLLQLVNKKTSALHPSAPQTSAALDMVANNAVTFLASKLPKDMQNRGMFDANKARIPNTVEMSKFERYVNAVDNPKEAIKEMESGIFSKESAEAIQAVYPNLFQKLQNTITDKMQKQKNIPYNKKLQIGMIFGTAADSSMQPENILALQANIASPPAKPNMGMPPANAKAPANMQSGSSQVSDES